MINTGKNLKTALVCMSLFFLAFLANPAMAQDKSEALKNSTPAQRAQMQTMLMKSKLQLDSAQTAKVEAINLNYAQQMEPVLKGDGGKLAKFRKLKEIAAAKNKELKAVFTAEQYKQYQALEQELKDKMMERMKDNG